MTRLFHIATSLLAGMLMAACTQDTDPTTRAAEGSTVPMQLALSLGTSATTRMSDATVQKDGNFRGIEDIHLIPFNTAMIESTTQKSGDFLSLEKLLKPTEQTVANTLPSMTDKNTALYKDVNIPIGTRGFLFYGRATQDNTVTDPHVQGRLTAQVNNVTDGWSSFTKPSDLTFSLQSIRTVDGTPAKATNLVNYMTDIANASVTSGTAWKDYTTNAEIHELYTQFITNIAGSSNSVQALLQDLYTNLITNYQSDDMAQAIIEKIKVGADINATANELTLKTDYADYPGELGLPDGTAFMEWVAADSKFKPNDAEGVQQHSISVSRLTDFVYPPCLYYRVNSGVMTSSSAQQSNYNDTNDWEAIKTRYTNGTVVDASTKSVALTSPVQYAVGRYDVTVKCNAATLPDKNNTAVTVPTAGFPVTAVFVAGQKSVDWEFKPKAGDVDWIIYDNKISGIYAKKGVQSDVTHTLVLETADDANTEITVAIELQNTTGLPFTGYDGQMIYAGSKFYLIGKLKATNASASTTGTTASNKVFEQDKITRANYNIMTLANAYNVIPDLRAPHLELGISIVDSWSSAGTGDVALE